MLYNIRKCHRLVVEEECLFTQNDAIVRTKFNATTQICCLSGVYDRYQEGLEVDCCGGKYNLTHFMKICALILHNV